MRETPCPVCRGSRLKPEVLAVTIGQKNIAEICKLSINDCALFLKELSLSSREKKIAERVLKEINARLGFLLDVGLDYLSLDRPAATLSGGEAQRIRLATQIGSGLTGVLYVLDEPSIGLHTASDSMKEDPARMMRWSQETIVQTFTICDTQTANGISNAPSRTSP